MDANNFEPEFLKRRETERRCGQGLNDSRAPTSARGSDMLLKDEVYKIVGCAIEVLKSIGHGLYEKPYENALVMELGLRAIPFSKQPRYAILYKGVNVGEYVPDMIAFDGLVVDAKVIDAITDHERGQMLNYLRITGHQVGLILNFKRAKLEWERIVLTTRE